MTNPNDPAFAGEGVLVAVQKAISDDSELREKAVALSHLNSGLTKREYFAAMAMEGILSSGNGIEKDGKRSYEHKDVSTTALEYADALIDELNKSEK